MIEQSKWIHNTSVVNSLGQTTPNIMVERKETSLVDPSRIEWYKRPHNKIIVFTINPADYSRGTPYQKVWRNISTDAKMRRINNLFKKYNDDFDDYLICWEFSESGRFHCHGLIYINNYVNYHHFTDVIRNCFGSEKHKNACYKGEAMKSPEKDALDKCINYITKDIHIMWKSKFRMKYITKDKNTLVITKTKQYTLNCFTESDSE